jgi:protein-serine/threonine kinase
MKPPMIPNQGRGVDTINFRNVKESESVDITGSDRSESGGKKKNGGGFNLANLPKGVPLDSGMATPGGEVEEDPFLEFNSVTLHHEEERGAHVDAERAKDGRW